MQKKEESIINAIEKQSLSYRNLKSVLIRQQGAVKTGKVAEVEAASRESERIIADIEALEDVKEKILADFSVPERNGYSLLMRQLEPDNSKKLEAALIGLAKSVKECQAEAAKSSYLLKNRVMFLDFVAAANDKEDEKADKTVINRTI
ncbi:MAG TPA: flagellar export chaperone FlgN [Candidatus Goldiibacteriota bacterium]|nr:flagellar export chaperone FlgN [Candidatus Goldiibacteriota bacterium]